MGSIREAGGIKVYLESRIDGIYGARAAYGIALFFGKHVSKARPTAGVG